VGRGPPANKNTKPATLYFKKDSAIQGREYGLDDRALGGPNHPKLFDDGERNQ